MKFTNSFLSVCALWLGLSLCLQAASGDRVAKVEAFCRSLRLEPTRSPTGPRTWLHFAAHDDRYRSYGERQGTNFLTDGEVRPDPARPGIYQSMLYLLTDNGALQSYPLDFKFTGVAGLDNDSNGVPDFLQANLGGSFPFTNRVTNVVIGPWPPVPTPTSGGSLLRVAGLTKGIYWFRFGGFATDAQGVARVGYARGSLTYHSNDNEAILTVDLVTPDGSTNSYRAKTSYAVKDSHTVEFPEISLWATDGQMIRTKACTLTLDHTHRRYLGDVEFTDGGFSTGWRDYYSWTLQLTDTNDVDGDDIPDLTDDPAALPVITAGPYGFTALEGSGSETKVTARGAAPLAYQWQFNEQNLPEATAAALRLNPLELSHAGDYRVIVSNYAGSVTSSVVTLKVHPLAAPPLILEQPMSATVLEGQPFMLSVWSTGSWPPVCQWWRGTHAIPGATNNYLLQSESTLADGGDYTVTVSNAAGETTSETAVVTVQPAPIPLRVLQFHALSDDELEAKVQASPGGSYALEGSLDLRQWTLVQTFKAAAEETTLRVPVSGYRARAHRLRPSFEGPAPPVIVRQPLTQFINETNRAVSYSVTVEGNGPFTYQWFDSGRELPGATGSTLNISRVTLNHNGHLYVKVSGPGGFTESWGGRFFFPQKWYLPSWP